jgi:hypothetical protein
MTQAGWPVKAVIGDKDCLICDGEIDAHTENARKLVDTYQPLAVVVQLGENESLVEVESGKLTAEYQRLLRTLTEAGAKRIYALSVWDDTSLTAPRTFAVRRAVRDFPAVRFIDLTDIPKDSATYGNPKAFSDPAVLWHPGNLGMRRIGERVAATLIGDL